MFIARKFPHFSEIFPVYAVIVILVYGWTIYWSLWKLPSWLDFLPLGEIGTIFCYLLATNFVESLVALLGAILLCFILPRKWFRDVFVSRGSMFAASILISIMAFEYHFVKPEDYFTKLQFYFPLFLVVAVVLAFLAGWIPVFRKTMEVFAENAVIFLYIVIPLSLLSIIVIFAHNIL
jgi:hypothetical protein